MNSLRTIRQDNVNNQVSLKEVSKEVTKISNNGYNSCSKDEHMIVALDNTPDIKKIVFSSRQKRFDELCALKSFISDLVREYATKEEDEYILWSRRLYLHDRRIILSHLVDAEDFEYYCSSPTLLELGLEEYDELIQKQLDEVCEEVFFEDQREFGRRYVIDRDHGDYVWY